MKCKLTEKKNMTAMLIVGLALAACGFVANTLIPEDQHLGARLAGFVSGIGISFAVIGGGVLLWRKIVGKERAADSELAMTDERGQMIAYKAQSVMAIACTFSLIALIFAALVRGDTFYMLLGGVLCAVCAAAKFIAAYVYGKTL